MTVATLQHIRIDHSFDLFWEVELERQSLDVEESLLPRRRKTPRRIDDGITVGDFPDDAKIFSQQYYKALDLITSSINDIFDPPGYKIYKQIEDSLLKVIRKENIEGCIAAATSFYHTDRETTHWRGVQFTLVLPSTNAISERSFSALGG